MHRNILEGPLHYTVLQNSLFLLHYLAFHARINNVNWNLVNEELCNKLIFFGAFVPNSLIRKVNFTNISQCNSFQLLQNMDFWPPFWR